MEMTLNENSSISEKDRVALEKAQPMWKMVLTQFLDHKLAVAGAVIIAFFMFISIFANVIEAVTGLDPDAQNVATATWLH